MIEVLQESVCLEVRLLERQKRLIDERPAVVEAVEVRLQHVPVVAGTATAMYTGPEVG
jgi:hypothetical protein